MAATGVAKSVGRVQWFNASKGFGFIRPDSGAKDVFVHVTAVQAAGIHEGLAEGDRVAYVVASGRDGRPSATELELL